MNIGKITKRILLRGGLAGLALAMLGGCQDITSNYYDRAGEETRSQTVPREALMESVVLTDAGGGELQLEFNLDSRASFRGKDTVTYTARFRPEVEGYGDPKSIVFRISSDSVQPGTRQVAMASLVNHRTREVERERPVLRYAYRLRVKFPTADLNNLAGFYANSYFRPDKLDAENMGPFGILASSIAILPEMPAPNDEQPEEQIMVEEGDLAEFMEELQIDTTGWRAINFPPFSTCPPGPFQPVTELDTDNDPTTREGKYNGSEDDVGGRIGENRITALLFIQGEEPATGANSWFCPIIVVDEDGDGEADPEEICAESTDVVGQCMYGRGRNSWHIDDYNKLQWISRDYDETGNPTGISTRFEYDPGTGNLKKFTTPKDEPEKVDYDGPSDNYYWDYRFNGSGCNSGGETAAAALNH